MEGKQTPRLLNLTFGRSYPAPRPVKKSNKLTLLRRNVNGKVYEVHLDGGKERKKT